MATSPDERAPPDPPPDPPEPPRSEALEAELAALEAILPAGAPGVAPKPPDDVSTDASAPIRHGAPPGPNSNS